jgi:hypothetical protein
VYVCQWSERAARKSPRSRIRDILITPSRVSCMACDALGGMTLRPYLSFAVMTTMPSLLRRKHSGGVSQIASCLTSPNSLELGLFPRAEEFQLRVSCASLGFSCEPRHMSHVSTTCLRFQRTWRSQSEGRKPCWRYHLQDSGLWAVALMELLSIMILERFIFRDYRQMMLSRRFVERRPGFLPSEIFSRKCRSC